MVLFGDAECRKMELHSGLIRTVNSMGFISPRSR